MCDGFEANPKSHPDHVKKLKIQAVFTKARKARAEG